MAVFRVRDSVLCDGELCVTKHMTGKSEVNRTFAENQHHQNEWNAKLQRANKGAKDVFGTLCDEIAVIAKNGNGNGSCNGGG